MGLTYTVTKRDKIFKKIFVYRFLNVLLYDLKVSHRLTFNKIVFHNYCSHVIQYLY